MSIVSVAALTLTSTGSYRWRSASFLISFGIVALKSAGLATAGREAQDLLDVLEEAEVQHLVGLVEHEVARGVQHERVAADQVQHAADGADHDLPAGAQLRLLGADRRAAEHGDRVDALGLAVRAQRLRDLDAQLARRREHERLDLGVIGVHGFHQGETERGGLARSGLRLADHVPALEQRWDRLLLDRARRFVADVAEGLEDRLGQAKVGKSRHSDRSG